MAKRQTNKQKSEEKSGKDICNITISIRQDDNESTAQENISSTDNTLVKLRLLYSTLLSASALLSNLFWLIIGLWFLYMIIVALYELAAGK